MRLTVVGGARIVVVPDSFALTLPFSPDTTRRTMTIRNPGTDTLRYTINESLRPTSGSEASILRSTMQQSTRSVGKDAIDPTPGESPDSSGGPDAFGYRWIDSDSPGGPVYNWVEIRTLGTQITWTNGTPDDGSVVVQLPFSFSFSFYGTSYSQLKVCTNGWLSFDVASTNTQWTNSAIPAAAEPNNVIYAYWDDLNFTSQGAAYYYYDAANSRFIVEYDSVPHFGTTEPGTYTFQAIIKSDGTILYQYRNMQGTLNSSTIGVENAGGTIALQTCFNSNYVRNNFAVLISSDLVPWLSTNRTSGVVAPGDSQQVQLRIVPNLLAGVYIGRERITGNTPDVATVAVHLEVTGGPTPFVRVTAPNGGELWNIGQAYNITWNQTLVDTVRIEYSTAGRTGPYNLIVAGVPARPSTWIHPKGMVRPIEGSSFDNPLGTYSWTIPNTPSTNCFVRILRKSTGTPADTSDAAFTIAPAVGDTNWVVQTSGSTATLYSVKAINNNVAWVGGTGGVVLRTTNGGTNWTSVGGGAIGTADVYSLEALDANTAFVTTSPSATFIYKTTNGGTLWTQVYTLAGGFIDGIQMKTATEGYALGDPVGGKWVVLKTTDGGTTWARMTTEPTQVGTEAGWNNSFQLLANTMWFGTNSSKVYRSTDLGVTWSSASTGTAVNSYGLRFNSATHGMAGFEAPGKTSRSTDGGTSWVAATAAGTGQVTGAGGVSGTEFWVTSGTNVYYTSNHGTAWTAAANNGYTGTTSLWAINMTSPVTGNTYGWAVGASGSIVRYRRITDDVASGSTEIPTVYALDQNFPNPFNPSTTIRFALPEQATVSLKIYNLLGQEITTLAEGDMPAAFHSVVWNGRNNSGAQVATGMYFYRFEATGVSGGEFISPRKLILLK